MGVVLALLLGIAAGFFVLAMPTHLLETVTTMTRLSKLMTQAEPPIMPYDKTVLAVLAGTLTAGIGWVAIDWLLFGRAGMRTLIREREDDYEESDGNIFRSTDPLDLVAPVSLPTGDWASSAASDPRRPLSARTDIGDPPLSTAPAGLQPIAMPGIDELLPPVDHIQPGPGAAALGFPSASPFQAAPPSDPFQPPRTEPQPGNMFGNPGMSPAESQAAPSWTQTEAGGDQQPQTASPARAWLPTPGVRPDGSSSPFEQQSSSSDADDDDALDLTTPQTVQTEPPPVPEPFGQTPPPLQLNTPQPTPVFAAPAAPPDFSPRPETPVLSALQPPAPVQPPAPPPLAIEQPDFPVPQPTAFEPPASPFPLSPAIQPAAPAVSQPPAFEPVAPPLVQAPVFASPAPSVAPAPTPPLSVLPAPAPRRASSDATFAGLDKGRLEDLLVRLERGLEARRAAAARAAAAPPAPVAAPHSLATPQAQPAPTPPQTVTAPQPPLVVSEPAARVIHHAPANVEQVSSVVPPAGFATPSPSMSQPVAPTTAPVYDLPTMPVSPAYNLPPSQPAPDAFTRDSRPEWPEPSSDALLDQPLHVTLDLLRNKVRR